jgi:hypothetical protein
MVTYAADPANGAVGFAHAHWATSINKMLLFLGPGKDNSVRAFDPVTNQWEYLWPNSAGANGPQARDNYVSFYVSKLDELWVWGGSYLEAIPNALRGGRFSIPQKKWVATSADDAGAFSAVIANFGGGFIDSAAAWSAESDIGMIFGGGAGGNPTDNYWIIEPNPPGPQPYKMYEVSGGTRPSPRAQCMNCLVAAGKDFYLFGGFYQEPNNPAWLNRRDLWKFDTTTRTWTQLPAPPDVAYAPVITYDSDRKALVAWVNDHIYVFDLATLSWTEQTPVGLPCIYNQVGLYAPTARAHLFEGGNQCSNGNSPGPEVFGVALGSQPLAAPIANVSSVAATITAAPAVSGNVPLGYLDLVSRDGSAAGWSYDPDVQSQSNDVHIYVDGPAGIGIFLSALTADQPRPDVNNVQGVSGNHGFVFKLPDTLKDGRQHRLYAYGIDKTGDGNSLLIGSPKTFTLGTVSPIVTQIQAPASSQPASTSSSNSNSVPQSGDLDLPVRTWVARPFTTPFAPAAGFDGHGGVGSKHLRFSQNPANGKIYVLGGDYSSDIFSDVQLWTYDIANDKWVRDRDPCGTQGEVMPGGPDEVGWVWDSKRAQFWVLPGFFFLSEGVLGACGGGGSTGASWNVSSPLVLPGYAVYLVVDYKSGARYLEGRDYTVTQNQPGPDQLTLSNVSIPTGGDVRVFWQTPGYALQKIAVMGYNPDTRQWTEHPSTGEEFGPRNAIYDPMTDSIWRSSYDGGRGLYWSQYHLSTNTRDIYFTPYAVDGTYINDASFASEYIAADITGRKLYGVDPINYRLLQFDMDQHTVSIKAPIPEPSPARVAAARARTYTLKDFTMPVFDSVNNVLLYPFVTDLSSDWVPSDPNDFTGSRPRLLIYHPDSDTWETDPMFQPEGREVRANSFFFDPIHNVLLAMGGLSKGGDADGAVTHFFIYRYGAGNGQTPAPVPPPVASVPGALKANFLGVTGDDKVGQINQTTSNGTPDYRISVSGLRGIPRKVTITSDTGGIWEIPFNGANWVIATSYDGSGNGDYWFEQFPSNKFSVAVVYPDGSTDSAEASNQAAPTSPPALQASIDLSPTAITFPLQVIGGIPAQQQLSLLNNGTGSLTISGMNTTGDFALSSNCPSELPAGGKCTITVTFQPLVSGTRTGALTISSNAAGNPHVVTLQGSAEAPLSPDKTPPTVSIRFPNSPLSGTVVGNITATDNVTVVKIDVYKDGTLFGSVGASHYNFPWDTTTEKDGPHTFIAVAYDAANNRTSNLITAHVRNVAPPLISIVAPASGSAITASSVNLIVQVKGTAQIATVQFKLDGFNLGPQLTDGSLSLNWDTTTAAPGNHIISAVVTDAVGNMAVSQNTVVQIIRIPPRVIKRVLSGRRF